MSTSTIDPRLKAFLDPGAPEVFHAIEHRHEIWRADPFDVDSLYPEARDAFARMVTRATTPPGLPHGRVLLLLGEAGSGKTHLLRVFRNQVHSAGDGFVGYLQMTTSTRAYGRYLLVNLIDSLDHPYNEELSVTTSGLMRLSRAMASRCLGDGAAARLREDESLGPADVDGIVRDAADELLRKPDYARLDLDLVRALLYLQRDDARVKQRVLKYLRCEDLSPADRAVLGGIVPRVHDDDPQRMVESLGRLAWELTQKSLVLCVDQLEDVWSMDDAPARFRLAMSAVCALADRVPSSIVVVSCLEDFYTKMRAELTGSLRDRLERDPEPVRLASERTVDEARQLVGRRLEHLYEQMQVPFDGADPVFPFPRAAEDLWKGARTRDVINRARAFREEAVQRGGVDGASTRRATEVPPPPLHLVHQQAWNDFRTSFSAPRPEEDAELADLLAWAISACGEELETPVRFVAKASGATATVDVRRGGTVTDRLLVGLCNKDARGGGLAKQLASIREEAAGKRKPVLVRSLEYPKKGQAADEIAKVIKTGGRRAVLEDSHCVTMMALREYRKHHEGDDTLAAWLAQENPLSQLPVLRAILDLDAIEPPGSVPVTPSPPPVVASAPPATPVASLAPIKTPATPLVDLGRADGIAPRDVTFERDDLRRHAAFLGGTGSGKTNLALSIVEQLLLQGVPVILVDRKGDLCNYLVDEPWSRPLGDPAREERRARLRATVAPALFTPGNRSGRSLGITLLPSGIEGLADEERADEAAYAAHALADMLGYKRTGRDQSCRAVLVQALRVLAELDVAASLESLIGLLDGPDPAIVGAVGKLDTKLFNRAVQDLETFRLTNANLVDGGGERLDVETLLGRDGRVPPGKTRLSVVSTKFFGDTGKTLFWIAQLLLQLGRWSSRNPSPSLQGAILFDEADLYLPATSQPATKAPMENLLRRARSAGLGVLLATQSPGDLDYKCRDNILSWFTGRITQDVAIRKMAPMLADAPGDVPSRLPSRQVGQFFLLRGGGATSFLARRPCIEPEQLGDKTILDLAAASTPR